jgi:hypothetical protein
VSRRARTLAGLLTASLAAWIAPPALAEPGGASAEVVFKAPVRYGVIARSGQAGVQIVTAGEHLVDPQEPGRSLRVQQVDADGLLLHTAAGRRHRVAPGQAVPGLPGAVLARTAAVRRIQYRYRSVDRVAHPDPVLASLHDGVAVLEVEVPERPVLPAAALRPPEAEASAAPAVLDAPLLSRVRVDEVSPQTYEVPRADVQAVLENTGRVLANLRPLVLPTFSLQAGVELRINSTASDGVLGEQGFTVSSPKLAERAGIQVGDRILRVNGTPVDGMPSLYRIYQALRNDAALQTIQVELERAGTPMTKVYRVR